MKLTLTRNSLSAYEGGIIEASRGAIGTTKYQYAMAKNLRILKNEFKNAQKFVQDTVDKHTNFSKSIALKDEDGKFIEVDVPDSNAQNEKTHKEYTFSEENKPAYEQSKKEAQDAINDFLNDPYELEIHAICKDDIPADKMEFISLENILDFIDPETDTENKGDNSALKLIE